MTAFPFPAPPPAAPGPSPLRTRRPVGRPVRPAEPAPGVLDRLRAETRPQHDALEGSIDLMDAGLTTARYRHWLTVLRGFHGPLERRLAAIDARTPLGLDLAARVRSGWLDADLGALGADPGAVPECADLPILDGASRALGALYVLEGSTLGARLICRHLEATLGLGPDTGARFFAGHGDRTGPMWGECRRALQRHVDAGGDADALVSAAADTFSALHRHVERSGS